MEYINEKEAGIDLFFSFTRYTLILLTQYDFDLTVIPDFIEQ